MVRTEKTIKKNLKIMRNEAVSKINRGSRADDKYRTREITNVKMLIVKFQFS